MAGIKKRKQPKVVSPEAAYGAGKAGKVKIKPRSHRWGRSAVVDSWVRHSDNLKSPPPKRKKGLQARGDADMVKWMKKLEKDAAITPYAKRRRGI